MSAPLEPWLRGPVPGVAPAMQPYAHVLLQVGEEVRAVSMHATEHAARHAGQIATLARVVRAS